MFLTARNELRSLLSLANYEHTKDNNNKRQVSVMWGDFHKAYDKYQKQTQSRKFRIRDR